MTAADVKEFCKQQKLQTELADFKILSEIIKKISNN